jgi:hypothetical protein
MTESVGEESTASYYRRGRFGREGATETITASQIQALGDQSLRVALEDQLALHQDPDRESNLAIVTDSRRRLQTAFTIPLQPLGVMFTEQGIVHLGIGLDAGHLGIDPVDENH